MLDKFMIEGKMTVKQNQDTIFIQNAKINHDKNAIEAEATFLIPNESTPKGILPVDLLHAWVASHEFDIPLILQPLQDSTFKSAFFSGDLAYNKQFGLQGNINFDHILNNIQRRIKYHRVNLYRKR